MKKPRRKKANPLIYVKSYNVITSKYEIVPANIAACKYQEGRKWYVNIINDQTRQIAVKEVATLSAFRNKLYNSIKLSGSEALDVPFSEICNLSIDKNAIYYETPNSNGFYLLAPIPQEEYRHLPIKRFLEIDGKKKKLITGSGLRKRYVRKYLYEKQLKKKDSSTVPAFLTGEAALEKIPELNSQPQSTPAIILSSLSPVTLSPPIPSIEAEEKDGQLDNPTLERNSILADLFGWNKTLFTLWHKDGNQPDSQEDEDFAASCIVRGTKKQRIR